jgi:hypothetical protein
MSLKSAFPVFAPILLALLSFRSSWAAEPTTRPAELQRLDRYIGTWDYVATITPEDAKPIEVKGTRTTKWILQGRFTEDTELAPDGSLLRHGLGTYDEEAGVYRCWIFDSSGYHVEPQGKWNEADQSFTSTTKLKGGVVLVSTERFPDTDTTTWNGEYRNADGHVVARISGKATRRK